MKCQENPFLPLFRSSGGNRGSRVAIKVQRVNSIDPAGLQGVRLFASVLSNKWACADASGVEILS